MTQLPPRPDLPEPPPAGQGHHRILLSRLALAVCLVSIAVLAFAPLSVDPGTGNDKINHLLAFGVLAALTDWSFPGPRPGQGWGKWSSLMGYGLLIEAIQFFLPYRDASGWDLLADGSGIFLYTAAARLAAEVMAGRTLPAMSSANPRKGG